MDHRVWMGSTNDNRYVFYDPKNKKIWQAHVNRNLHAKDARATAAKASAGAVFGSSSLGFLKHLKFTSPWKIEVNLPLCLLTVLITIIFTLLFSYAHFKISRERINSQPGTRAQLWEAIHNNSNMNRTKNDTVTIKNILLWIIIEIVLCFTVIFSLMFSFDQELGMEVGIFNYLFFTIAVGLTFAATVFICFELKQVRWHIIVYNLQHKKQLHYHIWTTAEIIFLCFSISYVAGKYFNDTGGINLQWEDNETRPKVPQSSKMKKDFDNYATNLAEWMIKHYSGIREIKITQFGGSFADGTFRINGIVNNQAGFIYHMKNPVQIRYEEVVFDSEDEFEQAGLKKQKTNQRIDEINFDLSDDVLYVR